LKRIVVLFVLLGLAGCGGGRVDRGLDKAAGAARVAFAAIGIEGDMVCGDPALIGEKIGPVSGNGACGIEDAVLLRGVDGVALSTPATIQCSTAKALKTWVNSGARKAVGKRGGGVAELKVAASYACRTRNHQRGAKLSEHSKGNAIDIAAVLLKDGSEISVLHHWGHGKDGAMLEKMHSAACGPFGTVLGPRSDRFHRDHFHFDVAGYRSGPYCK
jgi:hypothetical protein